MRKELTLIALAALMGMPTVATADQPELDQGDAMETASFGDDDTLHPWHSHPPRYRVVRRRRVVVVRPPRRPPPRRVVVVEEEEPVVAHRPTARLGLGLRVSGTGLDGHKIGLSDFENPGMAGFGASLRSQLSDRWGLELSADYLTSTEGDSGFSQSTVPVMLSALLHLFPSSPLDVYGLAGAGVHFTTLSYLDGMFEHSVLELAAQLGAGVQLKLGDHFAIHADLRFLTVYKNLGSRSEVSHRCLESRAGGTGYCNGLANLDPNDKFNIGAQFQAGATWFF